MAYPKTKCCRLSDHELGCLKIIKLRLQNPNCITPENEASYHLIWEIIDFTLEKIKTMPTDLVGKYTCEIIDGFSSPFKFDLDFLANTSIFQSFLHHVSTSPSVTSTLSPEVKTLIKQLNDRNAKTSENNNSNETTPPVQLLENKKIKSVPTTNNFNLHLTNLYEILSDNNPTELDETNNEDVNMLEVPDTATEKRKSPQS